MGLHRDTDLRNEKMFLLQGREGCFLLLALSFSLFIFFLVLLPMKKMRFGWGYDSGGKDEEGRHAKRELGMVRRRDREGSLK